MAQVRLFAAAADILGNKELEVSAATAGELREALISQGGGGTTVSTVIQRCSFLVDGVRAESDDVALSPEARVDVLPPFAGG